MCTINFKLYIFFKDIIGGDEESNCSTIESKNDRIKSEPPKKRARSKSVGVDDKIIDRGGLTASVVVAPTNDPTQPLSVVQVRIFHEIINIRTFYILKHFVYYLLTCTY